MQSFWIHKKVHSNKSTFFACQVRGDAFLGRIFDNDDAFVRMDFQLAEVASNAPWVKQVGSHVTQLYALFGLCNGAPTYSTIL
jgi:hypothetical protein